MNKLKGLTLLELIITLTISSILLTAAIPGMAFLNAKSDSKVVTSTIIRLLAASRAHAISHGDTVTMCGMSIQNNTCIREQFDRLVMFIDDNNNQEIDDDETLLQERQLDHQGQLHFRAGLNRTYAQFVYDGSSNVAGSFIYCDPDYSTAAARITLSMSGRAYIAQDGDDDGVVEINQGGDPIDC